MKMIKQLALLIILALPVLMVEPGGAQDIMDQYRGMSAGTEASFPPELASLMPAGFSIKSKSFIYKETANMFLFTALSGTRKNDVYKSFGLDAEIEVGVMAYNPVSAAYMKDQMPAVMEQMRSGYSAGLVNESQWESDPVIVSKSGKAEFYIQKSTRKRVELENFKYEDQVYYFANAICLNKNVLLQVRIIYYPLKKENVEASLKEIVKVFLATDFSRYMN